MSKTQQWLMGTVVVLLVIVGFVANALFLRTNDQLRQAQEQIASLKAATTTEPVADNSPNEKNMLARVANLLPSGTNVTNVLTMQNGLSLVGTVPSFDGGTEQMAMKVWLADTANNTLKELTESDISAPGVTIAFESYPFTQLARVHVLNQWEGQDERTTDYVNASSGQLLLVQQDHQGQSIELTRHDKTLKLELAPKDGCVNVQDPNKRISVTGLLANGTEVKFKKPYSVTCSWSDLSGMGYYPYLNEMQFDGQATAQGQNFATLPLPFGKANLTVDVDKMDASGIQIAE